MGNYKAIILHKSDKYSVAFYKNLTLVYGSKNLHFFVNERFQIIVYEQETHRNKLGTTYAKSGLISTKSANLKSETSPLPLLYMDAFL